MPDSAGSSQLPARVAAQSKDRSREPPALCASGLVVEVEGQRLLDRVDLTLRSGATTIIMGPNGAGKSLLLRVLHGLIQPTAGTVHWRTAGDGRPQRQAMVFQKPVLLRRSVAANIDFVLGLHGNRNRARRQVLLQTVGLADRAQQPARLLSGGEQQRLALARALAMEPSVLFLDEPTASLDPASVLWIEDIVRSTRGRGTTMLFVTHDVGQARRLGDEVVFLHRGQVCEQTPSADFFAAPTSSEARRFLAGLIVL